MKINTGFFVHVLWVLLPPYHFIPMLSYPSFQNIKIDTIEYSNDWNLHPLIIAYPSPLLHSSVQSIGLLHPPIVLKLSSDKYRLICGRSRLKAFQQIFPSNNFLTALILDGNITTLHILSYVLEDQLLSGNLSPMEKAYFFKIALQHMTPEDAADRFSPVLKEKVQPHSIKNINLLLELEPELQTSLHYGRIIEKTALELLKLEDNDRLTLHSIFQELELGGGKQKRLLELSKDLAFGQEKTITELLAESDFREILDHPGMNNPQKIANLLSTLQNKLFPQSNAAEEQFIKSIHKMELPASCTISHSPAFEKDEVSVTLHYNNLAEVEGHLSEIKKLIQK